MKETLNKRIVKRIVSPQMAIAIGVVTALGTVPYSITAENSADKKVEEAFPTFPGQLKQAQKEVLIFDRTVHNLISSGEPNIDATKFTDLSNVREAIRLIDEDAASLKQRGELRQNLQKPINKRISTIAIGGSLLVVAGMSWTVLRTSRSEINNTLSHGSSNT